jgi:hypothetical protein
LLSTKKNLKVLLIPGDICMSAEDTWITGQGYIPSTTRCISGQITDVYIRVQLFAFKSYSALFNSSWQNVLTDMVHRWNRASTADGANTLKDRLDLRLWAPDSTFNEFLEVFKELPVALEPSNGGVEEDSCGDLEELWMRKFLANELEGLKSQDMANDVLG